MGTWVHNPKPAKLNKIEKDNLIQRINSFIQASERLKSIVSKISIKAGRIYLYHLVEQFRWDDPNRQFIEPLIQGKYLQFSLVRITLYDIEGKECTTDWRRHTGQWYSIHEGDLETCLKFIEKSDHYYM